MNVLVGKCFGLGNAVLTAPLLKMLRRTPGVDRVEVLAGTTHDDRGALDVFQKLKDDGVIAKIHRDWVPLDEKYDVAIMAIPFDGRWKNGVHFRADRVLDGRTRPDPSDTTWGFHTWKKHEVEYMAENAVELGYAGDIDDCSFTTWRPFNRLSRTLYVGMGYKKMPGDPWALKHWGNERYAELICTFLERHLDWRVTTSCDVTDLQSTVRLVHEMTNHPNFSFDVLPLEGSFKRVASCEAFLGNDTGMMHVAAAFGIPTMGLFFMSGATTKNPPWCDVRRTLEAASASELSVEHVLEELEEFVGA